MTRPSLVHCAPQFAVLLGLSVFAPAAIALALLRLNAQSRSDREPARFAEVRVISNTTGDRDRQEWSIKPALQRLGEVSRMLSDALARG